MATIFTNVFPVRRVGGNYAADGRKCDATDDGARCFAKLRAAAWFGASGETKAEALSLFDIRASVVTPLDEIKATLLHATAYSGIPHRLSTSEATHAVLVAEGALK
ncbi:hypothetical protein [Burkholderia sp. BCC1638]|uniref:hypothetical protein n=1 Tax=Burkholderia sp. BCC1638 TaxID=2681391 RepID=UPI001FC7C0F4|nr:hypothetical protein [Burkholderia sp. BCC1638]